MEPRYYHECGLSQKMLNRVTNLNCQDKTTKNAFREKPKSKQELFVVTSAKTVPVLAIGGKPIKGSEETNEFLVRRFL